MVRGGPLGQKLRVLRAQHGLSMEAAAKQIGVQAETLSLLERGKRQPYTPTLAKIAKGYGVPVEELLEAADASVPLEDSPGDPRRESRAATPWFTREDLQRHGIDATYSETVILNQIFEDRLNPPEGIRVHGYVMQHPEDHVDEERVQSFLEQLLEKRAFRLMREEVK